jgi:hypothetical protein
MRLPGLFSEAAVDGDYFALVEGSTLRLHKLNLDGSVRLDYAVPFYGELISCCAISSDFKIAVCGTSECHLVICSIFLGAKVNVIPLDDLKPVLVQITKAFGFIVTYGITNAGARYLVVFDVNGRLLKKEKIGFTVRCLYTYMSRDAFDYLVVATTDGKIFHTEVFDCQISDPIGRVMGKVIALAHFVAGRVTVVISDDKKMSWIPLPPA